jgi:DNA repair protein RadC
VLKEGLLLNASGLILFHTHPSADPTPSIQDHLFTRRVAIGGKAVGLTLVDHLIVTADGRWHSMVQNGGW